MFGKKKSKSIWEWTSMEIYNLLCDIDRGHQPTEEEQAALSNQKSLTMFGENITVLPDSIGKLKKLQSLDLSHTKITALPESFGQLRKLQSLLLLATPIKTLPESFDQLFGLQSLNLRGTQITALPESIGQLTGLHELYLGHTNITALPESFGQLTGLHSLDLSHIKITALPESFGRLSGLQSLNLSFTNITALPESFGQLRKLESLHLVGTPIKTLPGSFGRLSGLQRLYLSGSRLSVLPECVCRLPSLQRLDLDSTGISELPDAFAENANLQYLDLSRTGIARLPASLGNLRFLEHLDLGSTRITKLPEFVGAFPNLQYLDLRGLTLPGLPKSLALRGLPFVEIKGGFERGVNLYETTLTEQDRTVFLEHPELIGSLYEDQITLHECRVLFLGDGGVGKSYTIRRIRNGCKKADYQTEQTPGVEILDYDAERDGDRFRIHFWDFGGQEILHSMHRCFLTDQTCYVVTVRTREDANKKARYWLRNVTAFAPGSPVLLYVNCWENADGRIVDESGLRQEFPQIFDVVYCSAKEAEQDEFRTTLHDRLADMVAASESTHRTVNRHWDEVRRAIAAESEKSHYLTKERYRALCRENGIEDSNAPGLLSFFNSLGICFSYHLDEEKKELEDYKLLNPVWLTNAIYAIIEEGYAQAQEGRIKIRAIEQMLGNRAQKNLHGDAFRRTRSDLVYTPEECRYVLDVAAAHNLCYRVDPQTVFFPALCRNDTPAEALSDPAGYPQHVRYLLSYSYLPDSVVHQLMVRSMKADLAVKRCWLQGLMLGGMDAHRATVRMSDDRDLRIDVWSKPNHPACEMFELLRREIDAVNKALNLKAKEFIVDGEDRYTVIQLLNAAKDHAPVYGPNSGEKRDAEELLGRVYADWIIPYMKVESGSIIVPIVPPEFHKRAKSDPALRHALYEAYNGICQYCGKAIQNEREMQVDHILPTKYRVPPELEGYVNYLKESGFDLEQPDYVENYLPAHGSCNRDKTNLIRDYPLIFWHEIALRKSKKVLELAEKYEKDK